MAQGVQKHEGAGLEWDGRLPLPRAEVGVAKAKAQVKELEAASQEAELREHGAVEAQQWYAEAAQAEKDMGRKRELQHEAGIAKHHLMCAEREKANAAASLEIAKEDKVEADKALAAQRRRVARTGAAVAGQEAAADAGTGGQEAWHRHHYWGR